MIYIFGQSKQNQKRNALDSRPTLNQYVFKITCAGSEDTKLKEKNHKALYTSALPIFLTETLDMNIQ